MCAAPTKPVSILLVEDDEQDRIEAHDLNVAGYMLKLDIGHSFTRAMARIDEYWRVAELPLGRQATVA